MLRYILLYICDRFRECFNNMAYALPLLDTFQQFRITQLEMLNVIVPLKFGHNVDAQIHLDTSLTNFGEYFNNMAYA